MTQVQWRDIADLQPLLNPGTDPTVIVLAGNGRWAVSEVMRRARSRGMLVLGIFPPSHHSDHSRIGTIATWPRLGEAVSAAFQIVAVVCIVNPTLVPVALGTGVAAPLARPAVDWLQSWKERAFPDPGNDRYLRQLRELLTARRTKPSLVVIDLGAVNPGDLAHVLEQIDRGRECEDYGPLSVLLLLDEPLASPREVTDVHSLPVRRLARWAGAGEAQWLFYEPLDGEGVGAATDCEPYVAALLSESAGGDDAEAARLWNLWKSERRIVRSGALWVATEELTQEDRRLDTLFDELTVPVRTARRLAGIAAQFGARFCSASVVGAYDDLFEETHDYDLMLDVFDALEDIRLVVAEGFIRGKDDAACWIYRFASLADHARALFLLPDDRRADAAWAVVHHTAALHADSSVQKQNEEADAPALLDRDLVRAALRLKDNETASYFQRRLERSWQSDELDAHVTLLLASASLRAPDEVHPRHELEAAADAGLRIGSLDVAKAAVSEALAIANSLEARRLGLGEWPGMDSVIAMEYAVRDRSYARLLHLFASIYRELREYQNAERPLYLALSHHRVATGRDRSTKHLWDLANHEREYGQLASELEGNVAARGILEEARDLAAELVDRDPIDGHLQALARAETELSGAISSIDGAAAALRSQERATDLQRELVSRSRSGGRLLALLHAESTLARLIATDKGPRASVPAHRAASAVAEELVARDPTATNRRFLVNAEVNLARRVSEADGAMAALGMLSVAASRVAKLYADHESLEHLHLYAKTELIFAGALSKADKPMAGLSRAESAVALFERLHAGQPSPHHSYDLGAAEWRLAKLTQQLESDDEALAGLERARMYIEAAAAADPSAHYASQLEIVQQDVYEAESRVRNGAPRSEPPPAPHRGSGA